MTAHNLKGRMRTNRCVKCLSDFYANYKSNVCSGCETDKEFGFPRLVEMDTLLKNQPGENKMSRAERAEIKRNIAIPIGGGKYKAGRIGENGRIQEKAIKV